MQGDKDAGSSHNVMRRFIPLVLDSQASKSHKQQEIKINYLTYP